MKFKYFDGKINKSFFLLFEARVVTKIGQGLVALFVPIFLFNVFGGNLQKVVIYYIAVNILLVAGFVWAAKLLSVIGFRKGFYIGITSIMLFYVTFLVIDTKGATWLIPLAVLLCAVHGIFYWLPYHVDLSKFTDKINRSRELGLISMVDNITSLILPIIAGILIALLGFSSIFSIAILLFLVSLFLYKRVPKVDERFIWSYKQTFKEIFRKEHRGLSLAFFGEGVESFIAGVIWPIFIFELLRGNFIQVGVITSLVILVALLIRVGLSFWIDKKRDSKKVLEWGTGLHSLGWIAKVFVTTASDIFFVGAYHEISKVIKNASWMTLRYETADAQGSYVDEFTILREVVLHSAHILVGIIILFMLYFLSLKWIFLIAALGSLGLNAIQSKNYFEDLHPRHFVLEKK